jgi:type IX secretion system PorP/SprF family membrane protein
MLFLLFIINVNGQKDFFNPQLFNPAYTGSWGKLGIMASYKRDYWRIKGANRYQNLLFQTNLKSSSSAIGINISRNIVGFERHNSAFANYAYRSSFLRRFDLKIGIDAGITNYYNDLKDYNLYPDGIPNTQYLETINKYKPNVGIGLLLVSNKYYLGISVPRLFGDYSIDQVRGLFVTSGAIFRFSNNIQLKPLFITQTNSKNSFLIDFAANLLICSKASVGGFYKSVKSTGAIFEWTGIKNFRIGYIFECNLNNLKNRSAGIHEFMIAYTIDNLHSGLF